MTNANKTLLIGIGNEFRGDDGVGSETARRLKTLNLPNLEILESNLENVFLHLTGKKLRE